MCDTSAASIISKQKKHYISSPEFIFCVCQREMGTIHSNQKIEEKLHRVIKTLEQICRTICNILIMGTCLHKYLSSIASAKRSMQRMRPKEYRSQINCGILLHMFHHDFGRCCAIICVSFSLIQVLFTNKSYFIHILSVISMLISLSICRKDS